MKKRTIIALTLSIFIISCQQGGTMRNTPLEAEPGTVEQVALPGELDIVATADKLLHAAEGKAVLYYYRSDGNYSIWSVWLWKDGGPGARLKFTGVTNGVAYLVLDKSKYFPQPQSRIGIRISTEGFSSSDPGLDQFCYIEDGDRFVVLSRKKTVYSLGAYTPRILSAVYGEDDKMKPYILVKLSGNYGLSTEPGDNGFSMTGASVIDAYSYSIRNDPANRNRNFSDTIILRYEGDLAPAETYVVSHTVFQGHRPVDLSLMPRDAPALTPDVIAKLPEPVLPGHPEWVELYWAAWRFMHEKITQGDPSKGFAPLYIDEGFNENIYQWDSCFMVNYAIYGTEVFPAMATLDNFYNHERDDGYICRCYNENTGKATGEHDINPPLFAWAEWRYYMLSGDKSRLARVLPVLDKYFQWVKNNCRGSNGHGLYWITDLGSGMDNSPRESYIRRGAWIDLSAQQALAALCISRLAKTAGKADLEKRYLAEYETIKTNVNAYCWNAERGNYYDRTESGAFHLRNTIASFWTMLAEISDKDQAQAMIDRHLRNPDEFYRRHLFPTLAANDPVYNTTGHYWRGGVWAPTDFMAIKGIALYDDRFAYEAASNHIANMAEVYEKFDPLNYRYHMPALTEPNIPRNGNGVHQIWEAYSPDTAAPGTRWDANLLVRQKFCGWSGVGPVALLIENVIGLEANAPANAIVWRLHMLEEHGIRRLKFNGNTVSLVASARNTASDALTVTYSSAKKFRLVIYNLDGNKIFDKDATPGTEVTIKITL